MKDLSVTSTSTLQFYDRKNKNKARYEFRALLRAAIIIAKSASILTTFYGIFKKSYLLAYLLLPKHYNFYK